MIKVRHQIALPLPIDHAFALMTHLDVWLPKADDSVVSMKLITDPPPEKGAIWVESLKGPMGTMDFRVEVTEFEPPNRQSFWTSGPILQGKGRFSFSSDADDETVVKFDLDISPRGAGWLFLPLLALRLGALEKTRLNKVAALVGSGELRSPLHESKTETE